MSDLSAAPANGLPRIRTVTFGDLAAALKAGLRDFLRAPLFGLVIGGAFALIGAVIVASLTIWQLPWLIYPFAIGFPLVGPFAAVGLYEVSRRLAAGERPLWGDVFAVIWAQRRREVSWMAFVMLFVFWIWMYQVRLLIALFLGLVSFASFEQFLTVVFTTQDGLLFLAIGHVVGAVLALVLFSITVISIPLLLEREVDMVTAMITSIKTVFQSPVVMLGWGVFVTLCVLAASLPFFLGLLVVLPVFGHATWHLYRLALPDPAAAP
ncbi:MAG: DUF2189 domain-containing protein [Alphaproteobacteria bacterium]|nr:DUF2189 domain-containing protein [Alphaproteobacteria bacterium]MDX5415753.1 DUF2189 domain-containing protein [Alphaproteobacteria bacterium]MDX5493020.1 DUF2189 domain-containing protein [Alphaproteobacteria bacterium]